MKVNDIEGNKEQEPATEDTPRSATTGDAAIGIGQVTPRNFVRWALQRFPKGRLFR